MRKRGKYQSLIAVIVGAAGGDEKPPQHTVVTSGHHVDGDSSDSSERSAFTGEADKPHDSAGA